MVNEEAIKLRDISKLPTDGYVIFPLSMSRITTAQSPEHCYKMLQYFEKKLEKVGCDVIFLYTNGLYYNNDEPALSVRKKTNQQMLDHKNGILKLVLKNKKYVPQAMHFIPWDYLLLNSPDFQEYLRKLKDAYSKDSTFAKLVKESLKDRQETEANVSFLLEELALNQIIRQKLVEFPKTLVRNDKFRLFVYPGTYLKADLYQWKKKILPQKQTKEDNTNPYYASQYNSEEKILYNFDNMQLD